MNAITENYVYNSIKNLGNQSRLNIVEKVYKNVKISNNIIDFKIVRIAFIFTLMRYLDSQDLIIGESSVDFLNDPEGTLIKLIRIIHNDDNKLVNDILKDIDTSFDNNDLVCLDDLRLDFQINDDKQLPLQAIVINGEDNLDKFDKLIPKTFLMGMFSVDDDVYLQVLSDRLLISNSSLEIFLNQVKVLIDKIISNNTLKFNECYLGYPVLLQSHCRKSLDMSNEGFIVDWLFRNSELRGDKIAHEFYGNLEDEAITLTWKELNEKSNQVAHWLLDNGLQLENRVSLCMPRCLEFYIIMAAIFKAGGCYTSIDPELPFERKKYIAVDSQSKYVFTTNEDKHVFDDASVVITNDNVKTQIENCSIDNVNTAKLDSLAYLLYTSGTTGNPKGCLIEHRALYWAMVTFGDYPIPISNPDADKRLAMASLAFDVHISEITQSWNECLRLVTVPRAQLLGDLREYIIKLRITHLGMVPSMIEALLETPQGLPIKYLISGGEKITDNLLEKWSNQPGLTLANFYGPTELTIGISARKVTPEDTKENVGKVFPSCDSFVVDKEMNIVPLGTPGELIVEGPLVARGYLNLDEVTKKSFINFPDSNSWAYRTGDLVRMTPDKSIEIMGRIDSQVKYRGVRLETEGVSNIIRKSAYNDYDKLELLISTFVTRHPNLNQEVLISFIANSNSGISVIERRTTSPVMEFDKQGVINVLKNAVDTQLPVYMRPAYIIPVNFIPLTLNGKSDNKVLNQLFKLTPMQTLLKSQQN